MYINIQIPQMTLDHIFFPLPNYDKRHVQDYDVVLKANRDALLGDPKADPPVKGILDQGMDYLLEANTLVGAQLARQSMLAQANQNLSGVLSLLQ